MVSHKVLVGLLVACFAVVALAVPTPENAAEAAPEPEHAHDGHDHAGHDHAGHNHTEGEAEPSSEPEAEPSSEPEAEPEAEPTGEPEDSAVPASAAANAANPEPEDSGCSQASVGVTTLLSAVFAARLF